MSSLPAMADAPVSDPRRLRLGMVAVRVIAVLDAVVAWALHVLPRAVARNRSVLDVDGQLRPSASNHSVATSSGSRCSMSVWTFHATRSSVVIAALSALRSALSCSP